LRAVSSKISLNVKSASGPSGVHQILSKIPAEPGIFLVYVIENGHFYVMPFIFCIVGVPFGRQKQFRREASSAERGASSSQ
jgi:hypothetical protein